MVTTESVGAQWRKSTHSNGQANCVEVAATGLVAVRDSKSPSAPHLTFTPRVWEQYIRRMREGR